MLYLDKEDQAKGLPEDCKMAPLKDPLVKVDQLLAPRPRTGTPTYLAIDLLDEDPPPHVYRHELESFFYILLWTALHYDDVGVRHPTLELVEEWEEAFKLKRNRLSKACFFGDASEGTETLDAIRPEFQSLRQEWIEPLYWLIRDARQSVPVKRPGQEPLKEDYDKDTYGGRLTFRTFMSANQSAAEIGQEGHKEEEEEEEETKQKDN
jgi:Fe-S-cluster containining protein